MFPALPMSERYLLIDGRPPISTKLFLVICVPQKRNSFITDLTGRAFTNKVESYGYTISSRDFSFGNICLPFNKN